MLLFYICIKYTITVNLGGEILRNFERHSLPLLIADNRKAVIIIITIIIIYYPLYYYDFYCYYCLISYRCYCLF